MVLRNNDTIARLTPLFSRLRARPPGCFYDGQDCGYVFTKGPKAWAALPDSYSCPPCGAPKRRFSKVPKGSASGKVEVKKSWFK